MLSPYVILADAADSWNVSRRTIVLMLSIPVIIVASAVVTGLMGKETYKWFTGEDGFAETAQVIFYTIAFVLNLKLLGRLWDSGNRWLISLYVVCCIGLFFMIGEELNWGQRLFGWETPDSLKVINKQKETNLHNIYGVGATFKWVQLHAGAYGTIAPLLLLGLNNARRYYQIPSFVIPHYSLIPFFVPLFVWRIYRNFFEAPRAYYFAVAEFNEVMELIFAIGLALFMLFQLRRLNRSAETVAKE